MKSDASISTGAAAETALHMRRTKRSDATYRQSTPLRVTHMRAHASQLFVTRKYLF